MFSRLYLHIPWCLAKCHYCAFNSRPLEPDRLDQTCALLIREMELAAAVFPSPQSLSSLYLGGGTPSLLRPEQINRLIVRSRELFGHADTIEITLEANPGTVSVESLSGYFQSGVTRLSVGAQTFNDQTLQALGRVHTAADIYTAFQWARQIGFTSIGLDLICGLPHQSAADWQQNLSEAMVLQPDHLSIYGLTIEEGTPFADRYPPGSTTLPDDDQSAAMLEEAERMLIPAGYEHYEISNFSRPGCRSEHNCGYWQRDGYLGIGPGAHSLLRQDWGVRWGNQTNYEQWAASIQANTLASAGQQRLSRDDALAETIFLGLRMADGIRFDFFSDVFGERLETRFAEEIQLLQQAGLLHCTADRISLTPRGMLLSNQVFVKFL
jgi:oxygen-independent coproporphyrinogen III oxidase